MRRNDTSDRFTLNQFAKPSQQTFYCDEGGARGCITPPCNFRQKSCFLIQQAVVTNLPDAAAERQVSRGV